MDDPQHNPWAPTDKTENQNEEGETSDESTELQMTELENSYVAVDQTPVNVSSQTTNPMEESTEIVEIAEIPKENATEEVIQQVSQVTQQNIYPQINIPSNSSTGQTSLNPPPLAPALPPKQSWFRRLNPYIHLLSLRGFYGIVDSPLQTALFSLSGVASISIFRWSLASILRWIRDGSWRYSMNFTERTARIVALFGSAWLGWQSLHIVFGQIWSVLVTKKILYNYLLGHVLPKSASYMRILDFGLANRGLFSTLCMLNPPTNPVGHADDATHVEVWGVPFPPPGDAQEASDYLVKVRANLKANKLNHVDSNIPDPTAPLQFIAPEARFLPEGSLQGRIANQDALALLSPATLQNNDAAEEILHRLPLPRIIPEGQSHPEPHNTPPVEFDCIVVSPTLNSLIPDSLLLDPSSAKFERRAVLKELAASLAPGGRLVVWGLDDASTMLQGTSSMADVVSDELKTYAGLVSTNIVMRLGRLQALIDDFNVNSLARIGLTKKLKMSGGYPVWVVVGSKDSSSLNWV